MIWISIFLVWCWVGWNSVEEIECNPLDVMDICEVFFDGCNTCVVDYWEIKECTTKSCNTTKKPYCKEYIDWYTDKDLCLN